MLLKSTIQIKYYFWISSEEQGELKISWLTLSGKYDTYACICVFTLLHEVLKKNKSTS